VAESRAQNSLVISLGFGILFATAITLVLVPAFYVVVEDMKRWAAMGFKRLSGE
jgi:multidrug efflux pump subunit AcrB